MLGTFQMPLVLRRLFWHIFVFFHSLSDPIYSSFQETYLPGFIARHYMSLFRCLLTLMIRGKSVGRISFDTGNNRLLEREKLSHIHLFRIWVCHSRGAYSINITYHISNHFNSIIQLNGASLHRAFYVHPPIVSKWLKYCWRDVKP